MLNFLKNVFGKYDFEPIVRRINALEPEIQKLATEDLKARSLKLKARITGGESLDDILPEAFALIRESAKRTLGQRHFDVQLIGGIVLHQGKIAEMLTGEGKTLSATAPVYLNALTARGVHVITVNDYLARRDTVWMGEIYDALGLTIGCLTHESAYVYDSKHTQEIQNAKIKNQSDNSKLKNEIDEERDIMGGFKVFQDFLRPVSRKEAYAADITYGTNHEFGFDYLRDNLAYSLNDRVQRGHVYAVIDEVDSILIDEARTPLIIAAPDTESSEFYKIFSRVVTHLEPETDYLVDEKAKNVAINDEGINKVEKLLKIPNIYAVENLRLVHYLEESLKAKTLFHRDKQYVVRNNEIIIVDEFTGRMMFGRRYSGGLHQAIEAKEGVRVMQETRTFAQITIQNYFRLYKKIGGMTGTAQTSAEEFDKVYKLDVVSVPPNREMVREDRSDLIYKTVDAKYDAIIKEVKERHKKGQPVLIGTASIQKNEIISKFLNNAGIPHEMLNAKNHEREGAIIAQAGRAGAVTVATNMAGRGVDIIFGGNPPNPEQGQKVRELGGLHVIGTERHEARRIDNQLRGRSGRQGDPGSTQFILSLDDDLLRIFGGDRIKSLMETFNLPEDEPIDSGLVTKVVNEAQRKVEGLNFDSRKYLLEYDDILNKQRIALYKKREDLLKENVAPQIIGMLDVLWMNCLEDMESLRESVGIRAYAQHEPLVEYRRESHHLFQEMMSNFEKWREENKAGSMEHETQSTKQVVVGSAPMLQVSGSMSHDKKVGRNDPCPCGAKHSDGRPIKYKHCHGRNV